MHTKLQHISEPTEINATQRRNKQTQTMRVMHPDMGQMLHLLNAMGRMIRLTTIVIDSDDYAIYTSPHPEIPIRHCRVRSFVSGSSKYIY